MPVIVGLIVVGLVIVWARKPSSPRDDTPQPKEPTKKKDAVAKQDGGNAIVTALQIAADKLTDSVFSTKEARTVAKLGLALAIAVGTLNVAAGVIVAIVVLMVANIVEWIAQATEGDNHQLGIDRYWEEYFKVKTAFKSEIENKAIVSGQKPDEVELDFASSAYADGFMLWKNILTAFRAFQGRIYGPGISGDVQWTASPGGQGGGAVVRAWKMGLFAGTQQPAWSPNALSADTAMIARAFEVGNPILFFDAVIDIFPPAGQTDYYRANESVAANIKTICNTWFSVGRAHANACGFLQHIQTPVPLGKNLIGHLADGVRNGFFAGVVMVPPDSPAIAGVSFEGYICHTPDYQHIIYTKAP